MRISDWSSDVCSSDLRARSAASLRNSIGTHESTITLNRISSPDKTVENPQQISGFPPTSVANCANVAAMDNPLDDWFAREILLNMSELMRYMLRWWPHRDDATDRHHGIGGSLCRARL